MRKISVVLIVDDNESDHVISRVAIEQYDPGIEILQAYDGEEALKILASADTQPDIIFLDINMPGMDGHEFLQEYAREGNPSSVVAMLTTSDQEADKEKCLTYPFVKEYIVKPLDSDELLSIAQKL